MSYDKGLPAYFYEKPVSDLDKLLNLAAELRMRGLGDMFGGPCEYPVFVLLEGREETAKALIREVLENEQPWEQDRREAQEQREDRPVAVGVRWSDVRDGVPASAAPGPFPPPDGRPASAGMEG